MDAHLHGLAEWNDQSALPQKEMVRLLGSYSQEKTNRFVFGPVEAATIASAADVTFDCKINRELTSVPNVLNVTIFCSGDSGETPASAQVSAYAPAIESDNQNE